jgi:hypothetical protein
MAQTETPKSLHELASLIRSKNAGPFDLTFDIMFERLEAYERCAASGHFTAARLETLLKVDRSQIKIYFSKAAYAIKISIPRPITQGDFGDPDSHAGQQYAGLLWLEIP